MWESVRFSPVTFSRAPLPSVHPTPHSHQKRMYTISMMKKTPPAASLAYVDRVFRYLASLLYFLDRLDKLLAFESNAEEKTYSLRYSSDICRFSSGILVDQYLPDKASPLCRTSSMLATMILCTSWSSVLMLLRFLRALLSMYDFLVFWI